MQISGCRNHILSKLRCQFQYVFRCCTPWGTRWRCDQNRRVDARDLLQNLTGIHIPNDNERKFGLKLVRPGFSHLPPPEARKKVDRSKISVSEVKISSNPRWYKKHGIKIKTSTFIIKYLNVRKVRRFKQGKSSMSVKLKNHIERSKVGSR